MEQHEVDSRKRIHLTKKYKKYKTGKPNFNKECFTLWSLIVRQRAGECEICLKPAELDKYGRSVKGMDAHHIVSRKVPLHKFNINNGICLCKGCHKYNPIHSPHRNFNTIVAFYMIFSSKVKFMNRFRWWSKWGREIGKDAMTEEEHYHRLLDIYISMLDGESEFPNESF